MTSNKEDYLKIIYDAGGFDTYVSNKVISEKLGIAPASVSEMLAKLQHEGLIEYRAYHGSKLSQKGLASCIDVVRGHKLWEVFLVRHLGYTLWEAHEEAHLLEHIASERMLQRLDNFLEHPKTCPHGSLIPQIDDPIPQYSFPLKKLCEMEINESARIAQVLEDKKLLDYLERSQVKIGTVIHLVGKDDYEGPVSFEQDGKIISVSYKAATQIFVQTIK